MNLSTIGWTDYSGGDLNFVTGCTPISAGCAHCYARRIYGRFGRDFSQVQTHPEKLARLERAHPGIPVKDRAGNVSYVSHKRSGCKPMCFVCDTGDLFHDDVSDGFIYHVLDTLAERSDVVWQILTKRAKRMRDLVTGWVGQAIVLKELPSHIWLGITTENQQAANERVPLLLQTPATVRFVSVEPMLEWMSLDRWLQPDYEGMGREAEWEPIDSSDPRRNALDWVICGAESGPDRRPFDVTWAVDLYEQCADASVPFFAKQDSGLKPGAPLDLPGYSVVREWPGDKYNGPLPF